MHDLVITGGHVVDGTGEAARVADVAIAGGRIVAVGSDVGPAQERIDASGLLVTPGFVDVHTHLDGQATWDTTLAPLVWHGVTTAIVGNCGVGFAPARPEDRDYLIDLMATVEDIPAEALDAGLPWDWDSYPDYLGRIDREPRTLDLGGMLTHGALRRFVMGERANDQPTEVQLARMCEITREAMRAGAVGLSTSRTMLHTSSDGAALPGTHADAAELTALARAVREGGEGRGVLEVSPAGVAVPEPVALIDDVEMLIAVARDSDCPVVFSLLQSNYEPQAYAAVLARVGEAYAQGIPIHPEVGSRPVALLLGFQGHYHPFASLPSYKAIRALPTADRLAALATPDMRARLLAERNPSPAGLEVVFAAPDFWDQVFVMGAPLNYYPDSRDSIQSLADRTGEDPRAIAYDAMMAQEGRGFLIYAINNWTERNRDALHAMITHPATVMGLADAGAHVTCVVDASAPTTFLIDWVRDAPGHGRYRIPLEAAIRKLTADPARLFGLADRGRIAPGLRADINIIDFDRLAAHTPEMVNDLPLGHPRLDQRASGYVATLVAGEVTQRDGALTGALPGRLARGS